MKIFLFFYFIVFSLSFFAQWSSNPIINTPVTLQLKNQDNSHAVSDTKGGAIISWDDNRNSTTNSTDIYAQRIKKNGVTKWISGGQAICTNTATQKSSAICNQNDGSAIITWEDNRGGNNDIYAQKIDSSGALLWSFDGVSICSKTTNQKNPKIISDNNGGAIIVWEDSLNNYWDVSAQRISATGTLLWATSGVGVCTSPNTQNNPKIEMDGVGGAIITWQDKRNNADYDIYAQRLDNAGNALWTLNGVVICNAVNTQNNPRIESDGLNGALIGWTDKRNATDNNIYAQHINASGTVQWTTNGVLICGATNNQSALDIKYIGAAGLVLVWKDNRTSTNEIYTQLVSLSGVNQLTTNGILISNGSKAINPNAISDGAGGAIIAWQDSSSSTSWNIKSQSIDSLGAIQWSAGGVIVTSSGDDQVNPSQVTDGNRGAVYIWEDKRNGSNYDIYANHLYYNGNPIVGIQELSIENSIQSLCFPNPITNNSVIQLADNSIVGTLEVKIYDAYGKNIKTRNINHYEKFQINPIEYPCGIYFYTIRLNEENVFSKGSFISAQ